ncbi:hypothetical protein BDV93DRAFT_511560 [Ceratobasidium sp. AG-I]|nr:hypothetical protein BDV93DRAFT_511560 [Ceratobasidium sp. AG-I]
MSRYFDLRLSDEPRRILYADDDHTSVEIAITVARDMALHGHLPESAEIIAPVWNIAFSSTSSSPSFSRDFVRDTISGAGLEMIWRKANFVPRNVDGWRPLLDELEYTDEQLEIEQRDYFCALTDESADPFKDEAVSLSKLNTSRWKVIQKMLAVQVDPLTNIRKLPGRETELKALELLRSYIDNIPPSASQAWPDSRPHSLAFDLSLKYKQLDLCRKFLGIIGTRIVDLVPSAARDLALAPRTGQIVREKVLEQATGLTSDRARIVTSNLVASLNTRLRSGEPRPHSQLSWASLLSEIDTREALTQDSEHEAVLPFLRPPATPARIALAETQLGITLPQDYKDFLAVSDGLGSHNLSQTTPLLSVGEIFWDTDHQELKVEYRRFESPNPKINELPSLERVLQISELDDEAAASWWLVEPRLVLVAKRVMGEEEAAGWLGVNYAEWNPVFSNRGIFRLMMERRLSFLLKDSKG